MAVPMMAVRMMVVLKTYTDLKIRNSNMLRKSVLLVSLLATVASGCLQAEEIGFADYLQKVRAQAISSGISAETIDLAFHELQRDERVIKYDRQQPEFVQTFDKYLQARVTKFRKTQGRRLFELHRGLLSKISEAYDVDAEYIVAFWGLETSFGRYQGKYSIVRSLATLGFDPRRSVFFTKELINALRILDQGHVSQSDFVGAWAGAMGQSQFMPSSFLRFAVDHDGDGKKNIWSNEADVFASIANYLNKAGWVSDAGWGAPVELTGEVNWESLRPLEVDSRCRALKHHTKKMAQGAWEKLGLQGKSKLPEQLYAVVVPAAGAAGTYLVGGNFRAILNYNCANKYAVSVGLLAEAIANPQSS